MKGPASLCLFTLAAVEQLLEDGVIHRLVLVGTELVAIEVNLDLAGRVLQLGKRGLAHDAAGEDAAGEANLAVGFEGGGQRACVGVHGVGCGRIRVDAQLAQLSQALKADAFLFGSDHGESVAAETSTKLGFCTATQVRKFA